LFLEVF